MYKFLFRKGGVKMAVGTGCGYGYKNLLLFILLIVIFFYFFAGGLYY